MKLGLLDEIVLGHGSHTTRGAEMCAMEAAAYIAGEPHSDKPACASPLITTMMITWNDSLSSNEERASILKDLIPLTVGTRTTDKDEEVRLFMVIDWIVREYLPSWLEVNPKMKKHVDLLRSLPEIKAWTDLHAAAPAVVDAKKEADATWAATWDAARDATWDAASAATRDATWNAAWNAAWEAAWNAASAAATQKLQPTSFKLQESARELVKRMCDVGKK